jgi:hypothetical protein
VRLGQRRSWLEKAASGEVSAYWNRYNPPHLDGQQFGEVGVQRAEVPQFRLTRPDLGELHVPGADLPLRFVYVIATNARTGDWAAPSATIRTCAEYTLSGLATQQVRLEYQGKSGPDGPRHHPDPVSVTAGSTVVLDLPA